MKHTIKSLWLLPLLSFLLILGITVLRALSLCTAYDAFIGYFESGNPVVLATNLLSAAFVILSLAVSITANLGEIPQIEKSGFSKSAVLALGVAILLFGADHANACNTLDSMGICTLLSVSCLILGLPLCLFTWINVNNSKAYLAFGCLALSLSFVFQALCHYLSADMPINGDLKTLYMFTSLSVALFFLSEAKRMLTKPNNDTAHRFFTLCCAMFSFSVGVSECFAHAYRKEAMSEPISHAVLLVFVGVYALSRLFPAGVTESKAEEEEDTCNSVFYAETPEDEISEEEIEDLPKAEDPSVENE